MTVKWFKQEEYKLSALIGRAVHASESTQNALDTFTTVADDLEAAVAEHEAVISQVSDEIDYLTKIQASARRQADRSANAADKIRELVS